MDRHYDQTFNLFQTALRAAPSVAGYAAGMGERGKTMKYGNKTEIGSDTVKPVSCELEGRQGAQTREVLQIVVTN